VTQSRGRGPIRQFAMRVIEKLPGGLVKTRKRSRT
jgi:hypothetical protein